MINTKRRNGLRHNKRGEDLIVDFWAILVFVIILVIIFIVFMLTKHQSTLDTSIEFKSNDASFMLQSFLRAKADSNGYETISDIIIRNAEKNDFSETEDYFGKFFQGIESYKGYKIKSVDLSISDGNQRLYSVMRSYFDNKGWVLEEIFFYENKKWPSAEAFIPKKDGSRLRIYLTVDQTALPYEQK